MIDCLSEISELEFMEKPKATKTDKKDDTVKAKKKKVDPLHGITLEAILTELVKDIGFEEMGERIRVNCFNDTLQLNQA